MIFGFNTDVKHGDTVYHVQSEARERELRLQTQVFLSGRCVAKRGTSYAEHHARPDFSTEQMHDLLRAQHREVIELVRNGRVSEVATHPEHEVSDGPDAGSDEPARASTNDPTAKKSADLDLAWLNAGEFAADPNAPLQFRVLQSGAALSGARITVRLNGIVGAPQYGQGVTSANGCALVVFFEAGEHGNTVALLVQATSEGQSITRKFQLRRPA